MIKIVIWSCIVLSSFCCGGCNKSTSANNPSRTKELWLASEHDYFLLPPGTAFTNLVQEANELAGLQRARPTDLDYDATLAVVYGRLFIISEKLGKRDEADKYYEESALRFNENRKHGRLPSENYSKEKIRELIAKMDNTVRDKYKQ